jgi:hypothetical protein
MCSGCGDGRRPGSVRRQGLLALVRLCLFIVRCIEAVLVDVVDDLVGDVVANALAALAEEANLGRRNVVLDQLRDHTDVVPPLLQTDERVI